jgi:hypothetical protein
MKGLIMTDTKIALSDFFGPNKKVLSPEEKLRYAEETTMSPGDPAYWMLFDGRESAPDKTVYREYCYICRDPDFARMGLPLCRRCVKCGGHVAADDSRCDDCGYDQMMELEGEYEEVGDSDGNSMRGNRAQLG